MALVDHEAVLLRLKRRLGEKNSWGQRELRAVLQELEVECARDERPSETLFRLYGPELEELFFDRIIRSRPDRDEQATDGGPARASVMPEPSHRRETTHPVPKEDRWNQEQDPAVPSPSARRRARLAPVPS